jgi:hypothetical protein
MHSSPSCHNNLETAKRDCAASTGHTPGVKGLVKELILRGRADTRRAADFDVSMFPLTSLIGFALIPRETSILYSENNAMIRALSTSMLFGRRFFGRTTAELSKGEASTGVLNPPRTLSKRLPPKPPEPRPVVNGIRFLSAPKLQNRYA